MIVVDASAFVEVVATPDSDRGAILVDELERDPHWVVPEHFRIEAGNALRGLLLAGQLDEGDFDSAFDRLAVQPFDVWPTVPLLPRVRELVRNATVYDAVYLALAEELASPLVTADAKLSRVPGIRCRVLGPV